MRFTCLGLAGCIFAFGFGAYAQQIDTLPDAPVADTAIRSSSQGEALVAHKYAKYIDSGQQVQPLRGKDKIIFSFAEQMQPWAFATQLLAAGWEQLLDANPRYGSDKAAFGERLGAVAIRQNSQAVFADGLLAAAFREDPRYYRMGTGKLGSRLLYAPSRVFMTRTDEGKSTANFSKLLGYAGASALSMAYYPDASAKWDEVWKDYGISLAGSAFGNIIHEFVPDLIQRVRHKNQSH
jgi:hypothetical protein